MIREQTRTLRALNVVVASIHFIASSPIMLVVALAIRLTSPGPILFTQLRVGIDRRDGRTADAFIQRRSVDFGGRLGLGAG